MVIVNATMFDTIWLQLLNAAYPVLPLISILADGLRDRRNEVYTG